MAYDTYRMNIILVFPCNVLCNKSLACQELLFTNKVTQVIMHRHFHGQYKMPDFYQICSQNRSGGSRRQVVVMCGTKFSLQVDCGSENPC